MNPLTGKAPGAPRRIVRAGMSQPAYCWLPDGKQIAVLKRHELSIISANIMDLWDWFIARPIQRRKKKKDPESEWKNPLYLHASVDWFRHNLLFWLPRWTYKKGGIVIEIIVILIFCIILVPYYI